MPAEVVGGAGERGLWGRERRPAAAGPAGARVLPAADGHHGRGLAAGRLRRRIRRIGPIAAGRAGAVPRAGLDRRGPVRPGQPGGAGDRPAGGGAGRQGSQGHARLGQQRRGRAAAQRRNSQPGRVPPASGLVAETGRGRARENRQIRPIGPPRPTLVAAGCDPALPLLEAPLGLLDPPVAFSWWPCPSQEALELAADGLVHAAGTHLRGPGSQYNIGPAAELLPEGGEVIGFCSWREGLVLQPGLAAASPASQTSPAAGCGW